MGVHTSTHVQTRAVRTFGGSFKTLPYCTDRRVGTEGRVRIREGLREKAVNPMHQLVVHRFGHVVTCGHVQETVESFVVRELSLPLIRVDAGASAVGDPRVGGR